MNLVETIRKKALTKDYDSNVGIAAEYLEEVSMAERFNLLLDRLEEENTLYQGLALAEPLRRRLTSFKARDDHDVYDKLYQLYQAGVSLDYKDFKSNVSVLKNPHSTEDFGAWTSGTIQKTYVPLDIEYILDRHRYKIVHHEALFRHLGIEGRDVRFGALGVAGGSLVAQAMYGSLCGLNYTYLGSYLKPSDISSQLEDTYSDIRKADPKCPNLDMEEQGKEREVIYWLRRCLDLRLTPFLYTFCTSGINICKQAAERNVDLSGAIFMLGGEMLEEAKRDYIESFGITITRTYAARETGSIGRECLVNRDIYHIQPGLNLPIVTKEGTFYTNISPYVTFYLLNVNIGDSAEEYLSGECCELNEIWPHKITNVRNIKKVTIGGMSLMEHNIIKIFVDMKERAGLGDRCGRWGFQLVEKDDKLELVVHPDMTVSPNVKMDEWRELFLDLVGIYGAGGKINSSFYRDSGLIDVVFRQPERTDTFKGMPVVYKRNTSSKDTEGIKKETSTISIT